MGKSVSKTSAVYVRTMNCFKLIAFSIFLALVAASGVQAQDGQSSESKENTSRTLPPYILGSALYVNRDGTIAFKFDLRDQTEVKNLRLFATEVSPEFLAILVTGRQLSCWVVYEIDNHIAGQCRVEFSKSLEEVCNSKNAIGCFGWSIFERQVGEYGLKSKCTEIDDTYKSEVGAILFSYDSDDPGPTYDEYCAILEGGPPWYPGYNTSKNP